MVHEQQQQQVDVNRVLQKLQARIGEVMFQNAVLEARLEELQSGGPPPDSGNPPPPDPGIYPPGPDIHPKQPDSEAYPAESN